MLLVNDVRGVIRTPAIRSAERVRSAPDEASESRVLRRGERPGVAAFTFGLALHRGGASAPGSDTQTGGRAGRHEEGHRRDGA